MHLNDFPIAKACQARRGADRQTRLLYAFLFGTMAVTLLLPFSRRYQRLLMESRHLKADNYGQWAVLQFVPTMYNFANQAWMSRQPIPDAGDVTGESLEQMVAQLGPADELPDGVYTEWLNHYPPRLITFGFLRRRQVEHGTPLHFRFRSRYRGQQIDTHYVAVPWDGDVLMCPIEEL